MAQHGRNRRALGRDAHRIERIETDERAHQQRAVLDAARERPHVVVHLRQRHDAADARKAVRRLEPDDAAARRGKANGRRGVRPERARAHARGNRRRRAARRPARRVVEIPRIVDRTVVRDHARPAVRELVHVELAEEHGARVAQLGHHGRVLGRHAIRVHGARGRREDPGGVDVVLETDRNAVQRPAVAAVRKLGVERAGLS